MTATKGSASQNDTMIADAMLFYIGVGEYENSLKLVNDKFGATKDSALPRWILRSKKFTYALKQDWTTLSGMLTDADKELKALMFKNTNNKKEFDLVIATMKRENATGRNFFLLTGDYQMVISQFKAMPLQQRYVSYQSLLSNPFAQEFIKTQEFKDLFAGHDAWSKEMMARIKRMN